MAIRTMGDEKAKDVSYTVFSVSTNQGDRHLRRDTASEVEQGNMVVVVQVDRFLKNWDHPDALGNPAQWAASPSYRALTERFQETDGTPLHLPHVRLNPMHRSLVERLIMLLLRIFKPASAEMRQRRVSVVSGRHRVLWLIANGATAIPVSCHAMALRELTALVGEPTGIESKAP